MNINLNNSAPVDFESVWKASQWIPNDTTSQYEEVLTASLEQFSQLIFTPLVANKDVSLSVDSNNISQEQLTEMLVDSINSHDDKSNLNDQLSLIFWQASRYKDQRPNSFKNIINDTQLVKSNLPTPSATIRYTYADVQVPAKDYLVDPSTDNFVKLSSNFGGYINTMPIGNAWSFVLADPTTYQKIQSELDALASKTTNSKTITSNTQLQQIKQSHQDIFTAWLCGYNDEPESIQRLIQKVLSQQDLIHQPMPINLKGVLSPIGVVFIDPDKLANTDNKTLLNELTMLNTITNRLSRFKAASVNKIKNAMTINTSSHISHNYKKHIDVISTRKDQGFNTKIPSIKEEIYLISKLVTKFTSNKMSDNTYKTNRPSFMKANRRQPDNIDRRGTITNTSYRPDIHIYLDTSGSISESQYKTGVTTLIAISKKLNTNLFFTSFSHVISQTVKLQTKQQSISNIYRQISAIPKVSGGTEYENVWKMIDATSKYTQLTGQASQLNFIITDFAYYIRDAFTPNLKNDSTKATFYLPLAANQDDYNQVKEWALEFGNSMIDHGDLNIKNRMLF